MAEAIPKIYDEAQGKWIELMAKPIAEEVVKIMKNNFLENKGQIKLLELPYGYDKEYDSYDYTYYMFYNSKVSQEVVDSSEVTLKLIIEDIYNALPEKRELTYNDLKQDYAFHSFEKGILEFNVYYQDEWGQNQVVSSKNTKELELYNAIGSFNFTVSYIFNDRPLEEKQFKHTI
nr:MAG TPA: hypothetical protein [Herelleviridae sp.]